MNRCPQPAEIENYFRHGVATDSADSDIAQHLESCQACAKRVNDEQLFENLKEIFGEQSSHVKSQTYVSENDSCVTDSISIDGYTIVREIYRGGQGIVLQAVQIATKRKVAIKLLIDGRYATEEKRIRFEREIDLVAQLKHPYIVTIYDSGHSGGQAFYSMEYVEGTTLDKYVRSLDGSSFVAGATDKAFIRNILRIFLKIGNAVGHAHRHGVIHRDLKRATSSSTSKVSQRSLTSAWPK